MKIGIKKLLSVLVTACFVLTSIGGQAAASVAANMRATEQYKQIFSDFMLPYSYGKITDAHFASTDRVIINIQDLHCHPKVQKNISNIIDLFDKRYGVKTVYLEGAYGDVDTSWVAGGVDANYKSKLLDKMIETGRLTGAEYYSALSGKTHIIKGLETKEPYLENLKRFGDILENKDKIELILKSVDKSTQDLKNKYYDRRQFKLEQLAKDFAAGKINSEKYYILLSKHINKLGIDIYKYENTLSYMNLLTMQNDLKYAKITEELQHLVFLLKEQLPFNAYKMLLDSTGNFAQTDKLYEYLMKITRQYNLDLSVNYPELNKYFGYIELSQKINPLDLITEEKDLINEINTRFSSTKAQRDVVFMAKFEKYLENYLTSKITKEDYEYYTANIGRYKKLWDKYVDNRVLHMLDVYMAEADKFYKINTDRNEYFTKNITDGVVTEKIDAKIASAGEINKILENMRSVKRVDIIITGGFHTTSISQILNNQNLSYIVITPNVSEGTKYAEDTYYKIVKEQSKISFQTLANLIASLSPVDQIKIWNMADPESLRSSDYYKQNREQVERILSREGILSQSQMDSIKDLLQFIGYSSILESDDTGNVSEQIINLIKENLSKNSVLVQQVDEDLLKYIDIEKLSQALKQMQETDAVIKEAVEKRKLSSEGSVSQALVIIGKIINDINAVIERYQSAVSKVKSQADIEERIARINPAKYEFIKDTPILGYKITSSKFEDLPEIIRNNLGTVDRTVYTEEYLGANIGNIIALQVKDGQPDFYIVSNYREKYKEVDKAEVSQKNPKMFTKVTGITGMDELISGDKNIVGALKTAPVQMIKMSDIGYDIESEITIQSPWGEQTKPAGKEAYLVFDTTTNQYYMVNTDDTGLPLSYLVYGQTNAEVLDKVKSIMQDVGMSEEMAAYIGNDYNRQNGYAEEPVARVSQESGDAGVTKADEKTAMNLAGFYAVESGAGVISERTGKSVMEVLESIENGTISREDMLLIARFANATWKAGQFFRSPSRIGKGNFIPAVQLSNEEVQKDIDQIKAVTEKILGKMREKGLNAKSGSQEQLEYLKQLLQDKGFAIEMAQWCNDAYYRGIGQEAPEFITEADRTTSSGMTKNQQKVAMNLAGFYALETGVGYLSERSGKSFREIIDSIVDGSISEEDMLLIARFANATWKAGQPFRSLDRITRDTFRPAAMLIDSELKKDFDQIKAAAFVLQQKMQSKTTLSLSKWWLSPVLEIFGTLKNKKSFLALHFLNESKTYGNWFRKQSSLKQAFITVGISLGLNFGIPKEFINEASETAAGTFGKNYETMEQGLNKIRSNTLKGFIFGTVAAVGISVLVINPLLPVILAVILPAIFANIGTHMKYNYEHKADRTELTSDMKNRPLTANSTVVQTSKVSIISKPNKIKAVIPDLSDRDSLLKLGLVEENGKWYMPKREWFPNPVTENDIVIIYDEAAKDIGFCSKTEFNEIYVYTSAYEKGEIEYIDTAKLDLGVVVEATKRSSGQICVLPEGTVLDTNEGIVTVQAGQVVCINEKANSLYVMPIENLLKKYMADPFNPASKQLFKLMENFSAETKSMTGEQKSAAYEKLTDNFNRLNRGEKLYELAETILGKGIGFQDGLGLEDEYKLANLIVKKIEEDYLSKIDVSDFDAALATAKKLLEEINNNNKLTNKQKEIIKMAIMLKLLPKTNAHQHLKGSASKEVVMQLSKANSKTLFRLRTIMQDVGMSEEMAAYIGNDYNRQNGYAEEPVARVSQESGDAGVTKADEKTAMNLAGFYAVESGAGVISERTGKSVMEVLESIENGTISREDMLLIARFANATWKAGQFFRSPSRIGKGNFIPAVQLSNEEVQKDIDQIKAVTEKILGKMREKGLNAKSGSQEQLEYLKQLLQNKEFAIEMAQWCNDAYYRGIGQEAPEFIAEADRTTSSGMTKNQQKVAMNLAGFYALETGVGYLSERSGKSFREIIDSIVDGSISEEDMLLIARFANATWKAGQPFRSLDRITRDTFRPAAMLIDSELKKDFDQIKAAAFILQQKLDEKLENAYSEAEKGFANLDKFNEVYGAIASVISTDEDYKAVIKGIITDAVKQGQTIVEIRCAVDSLRDANGKALAPEEGAKIILDAIKGTCEELAKRGIKPPKTSLVFLGYRGTDWDQSIEAAMAEAELAVKIAESEEYQKKYSDISFGFDIAGPEDTGWAPNAFSKVYEVIRNHNAKNGAKKIGLTIHSGETPKFDRAEKSPDGYVEGTGRDGYLSIGEAVGLGVDRIGHGVQAITDPAAMEVLKNSGATVEICGVCNILSIPINTRGLQQHPIQNFLDAGVPVTICTDNNAICASDITMEYFMFLLTGHSSFMNWNMVKAVARNGISSAFISEGDKEDALKDFKQKVSRIETVLAETEIAGAEETVQKESEQPSSEPAVKETSSGTTLSVPQMKNVLNPVGAIQKTAIEIIAGRQAVEKLKEGKADVKEALVIINDIAKAEELRQEGLNAAAAVVVRKEEKSKLKGSKKIGTIGQYKGAAVRVYWNEKTKQLMFYSKEGLDGADVEVLKEMFANMQTEGIKADTFKGISQVVVTDKENYDETIKAMENSRTDAQAAIMIVKGIELDLTKRTGKINETICKNECAASGATTFIITEQQAAENSQDIEKMQKEGYKFIIKHAAVIGAESVIYDGAKIDATGLQDYNQAIKLLEGLRTKALAKGGISIKFNESIYKMLSEAGIDVWQQYGIIPSVNSDSAYIDGQIGKVEVEEITEQNIDSILSKDSVMTIVVDNAEILSDRKDAVKEAKTAKGKQKKEYKAVLNGNIPYAFNANSEADIKALISEVADIIEEDLTEEAASADVDKRAKVISHIENIQQTSFYRSLNEKARSRIDHLMKDKDAVQKTAAFIRAVAMRTAEEQILSEMAKNGIDIKTEEFRKFQDGRFREGILIRAVQLWLAGQNIVELLATEFIDSNMTAEEYMNAIMSKAEGVASNIGAICIKNEYTIRPEKDVAAAIEEFKEFNVLLQDRFRQMGIDKEVKVSVFAVKSILSAA